MTPTIRPKTCVNCNRPLPADEQGDRCPDCRVCPYCMDAEEHRRVIAEYDRATAAWR